MKGFHYDFHLFLEHLAVGFVVRIGAGDSEGVDLPRVVAAPDAEYDPSPGEDVGGGVVLGQPQGVPHGVDVEPAAELEVLGQMGQVDVEQQQIGQALVALPLEVVLRRPEGVVAHFLHLEDDGLGLVEHARQLAVGKPTVVDGRTIQTDVIQVHVPSEKAAKFRYHCVPPSGQSSDGINPPFDWCLGRVR